MSTPAEIWVAGAVLARRAHADAERVLMNMHSPEIDATPAGSPVATPVARVAEGPDERAKCLLFSASLTPTDAIRLGEWLLATFGGLDLHHALPDEAHWLDCAHWTSGRCSCRDERGDPK